MFLGFEEKNTAWQSSNYSIESIDIYKRYNSWGGCLDIRFCCLTFALALPGQSIMGIFLPICYHFLTMASQYNGQDTFDSHYISLDVMRLADSQPLDDFELWRVSALGDTPLPGSFCALSNHPTQWWFSARLWYLQCISTGDTTVLHWAIKLFIWMGVCSVDVYGIRGMMSYFVEFSALICDPHGDLDFLFACLFVRTTTVNSSK